MPSLLTRESESDTGRLEAFSDGVLAIAITLLVLDIRLDGNGGLGAQLRNTWPHYVAYVTAFLTIAVMWANHHDVFKLIDRTDRGLMFVNALLLLGISFLPFPTSVLADGMRPEASHGDRQAALLAYGGTMVVIAIFYQVFWRYAVWRGLLRPDITVEMQRRITRAYNPAALLYAAALPLSFFSAWFSIAVWIGLAVFFMLLAYEPEPAPEPVPDGAD